MSSRVKVNKRAKVERTRVRVWVEWFLRRESVNWGPMCVGQEGGVPITLM